MSRTRRPSRARTTALLGAGTLLAAAGLAGLAPQAAVASSHREAPGILGLPQYDNTDVFAFVSPDDRSRVTLIADWIPMEEPAGGPNFYPWATDARYEIHIDNDHDAKADLTYRWVFKNARTPGPGDSFSGNGTFLNNNGQVTSLNDPNLLFRQTYDLWLVKENGSKVELLNNAPVAPSRVGIVSMPDYRSLRNAAIRGYGAVNGHGGSKSFAGQTEDPFFVDLRVFDLLYGDQSTCNKEIGNDTLAGYNTNSIALQVPKRLLVKGPKISGEPVIGVWSTTSRRNASGGYTQISRLGQPLVNEAVIPYQVKDTFNAIDPTQDAAALPFVVKPELAALLKNVCGVNAPTNNRDDLVQVFLKGVPGVNLPKHLQAPSEQLRLNVNPFGGDAFNRLGVIGGDRNGFPNGRRLQDDVVDIALQVIGGELKGNPNNLGDAVDHNDRPFGSHFPYIGLPESGSTPQSAPMAHTGRTLLTGGGGPAPSNGAPVAPMGFIGLGALFLIGGAVVLRRRHNAQPDSLRS